MTPFDPQALLAMLLAFYPIVTIANLRLARAQRPDYFAGGVLFGSCGEKLRLPDGRVFDLMFDCGGPSARWQVIEPGPGGDGGGGLFELEPGPLAPLELPGLDPPPPSNDFEQRFAGALLELGASEDVLDVATTTIVGSGTGAGVGDALQQELDGALSARASSAHALTDIRPEELLDASAGADGTIEREVGEFPDPGSEAPPELPPEDPGNPPPPDVQTPPEV